MIISIDPSIRATGYAVWSAQGQRVKKLESGTWHPSHARNAPDRHTQLSLFTADLIKRHGATELVIETSERAAYGRQARMSVRDATVYGRAVGNIEGAAIAAGIRVVPVSVPKWKRNLKKGDTLIYCRAIGVDPATLDESDAIGLGLWYLMTARVA